MTALPAPTPQLSEFSRWERALVWPMLDALAYAAHPGLLVDEIRRWRKHA